MRFLKTIKREVKSLKRNIYQLARETKGITQEKAAEILDICTKTLREYELDKVIPNNKMVAKMVDLYDTQWLAYKHLRNIDETNSLPELDFKSFEGATLNFIKEFSDMKPLLNKIIEISCNGEVNEHEKEDWELFLKEAEELMVSIITLKYSKK